MLVFTVDKRYYVAYARNDYDNPHPKKYPCIFDIDTRSIPMNSQKKIVKQFLKSKKLDYHELCNYKERDINTTDLINVLLTFYKEKRL